MTLTDQNPFQQHNSNKMMKIYLFYIHLIIHNNQIHVQAHSTKEQGKVKQTIHTNRYCFRIKSKTKLQLMLFFNIYTYTFNVIKGRKHSWVKVELKIASTRCTYTSPYGFSYNHRYNNGSQCVCVFFFFLFVWYFFHLYVENVCLW